jgi:hypothetical protein
MTSSDSADLTLIRHGKPEGFCQIVVDTIATCPRIDESLDVFSGQVRNLARKRA